jgi:hypothetical protein
MRGSTDSLSKTTIAFFWRSDAVVLFDWLMTVDLDAVAHHAFSGGARAHGPARPVGGDRHAVCHSRADRRGQDGGRSRHGLVARALVPFPHTR